MKNEHLEIPRVLVFTIDPFAQRRFATPVESTPAAPGLLISCFLSVTRPI